MCVSLCLCVFRFLVGVSWGGLRGWLSGGITPLVGNRGGIGGRFSFLRGS